MKNSLYTEEEVEGILATQRGNCFVAVLTKTKDRKIASLATKAPEPGLWRKEEVKNIRVSYPDVGTTYRHYKGGSYKVRSISIHSETGEVLVNYQSLQFGSHHSRPLDEWNKKTDQGHARFNT